MNSTFKQLQKRHENLTVQATNNIIALDEVKKYIEDVRTLSKDVPDIDNRNQLQANLRYWANYIYDEEKIYPNTDLLPSVIQPSLYNKRVKSTVAVSIILIASFIASTLALGTYAVTYYNSTPTPSPTPTSTPSPTLTSTPSPTPTSTPSPTPTSTPSPTPTSTPSPTPTSTLSATSLPLGLSVALTWPQNGDSVEPRTKLSGDYTNLRPTWSIHALLQPVSQGGVRYPMSDFYPIPINNSTGLWQIETQFGTRADLQNPERYVIEIIVAINDAGRDFLAQSEITGFIGAIPPEFIVFPPPTTVDRAAYEEINGVQILFYSQSHNADETFDLYSMDVDGSNSKQLTNTPFSIGEIAPSLSPDGQKIVFIEQTELEGLPIWKLVMMDVSGRNYAILVENLEIDIFPIPVPLWSPDGKYIVYNSKIYDELIDKVAYQIFLYEVNSGKITQLTHNDLGSGSSYPSWMPNSQEIIYRDRYGIHAIDINSQEITDLFNNFSTFETHPDVSPDGRKIAFTYYTDSTASGNRDIYVLDIETRTLQQVTTHGGLDWLPRWHPNGELIYFESYRFTGLPSIWAVGLDGDDPVEISVSGNREASPYVGLMQGYLPVE